MFVYLRDGSAQTIVHAATLRHNGGWLLSVPATCLCTSGMDLRRRFVHAATLRQKWHIQLAQSQYTDTGPTSASPDARRVAGLVLECKF